VSASNSHSREAEVVLVDGRGKPTGTVGRFAAHEGEGRMHLAFTVVILDPKGQVLLARRAPTKPLWPRFFDATVASHPHPDEDLVVAARRRVQDELGVDAELEPHGHFRYHARDVVAGGIVRGSEKEHCAVFLGRINGQAAPDPKEVDELRAAPPAAVCAAWSRDPRAVAPWAPLALLALRNVLAVDVPTWAALERAVAVWPDLQVLR